MRRLAVIGAALLLFSCSGGISGDRQNGAPAVDFDLSARLEEDLHTGYFQLKLRSQTPVEVFYEILDRDGSVLTDAAYRVDSLTTTRPERLPDVRPWNAETPEFYTLHLQAGGRDSYHPLAFRRISPYKKDSFWVNGHKVPFKGADFKARNRTEALAELSRLKQLNVNALNTAPLPRELAELADSAGFYLYPQWDTLGRPNPGSQALKQARQELEIRPLDLQEGVFSILNHRQFSPLSNYTVRWWVEKDGKAVGLFPKKKLHFDTPPEAEEEFRIRLPKRKEKGEYRLFFAAGPQQNGKLLAKETVLATEEFLLQEGSRKDAPTAAGTLTLTEGDTRLVIRGKDVEMVFDRAEGSVKSLQVKGKTYLEGGLVPLLAASAQCSWQELEDRLVLQAQYPLSDGGRKTVRFTLFGNGILKVESRDGMGFRLSAGDGLFLGRLPDSRADEPFKTIRATEDGTDWNTETSWLETPQFTLVGNQPFNFRKQGASLEVVPADAVTLIPGKKHSQASIYTY